MFKTAATKIAHNSTIPALGGNKDLRPLQDLITTEKSVLVSLQKLSVDFGKAAEALRVWGSGEGEDLYDTLSASTNLLNQFSASLSNYASHEHAIRDHMKSIRSREEALDELKRRRKGVISKADAAEKKLSKMSPEHKNLHMQTETLNRLRDEIRSMDSEIMSDEAALGDFKRSKAKALMGLKFGGLLECCEKGSIIGEFGRLIIGEIPEEPTQPGMSRAMYLNHQKVSSLLSDASRCVEEVTFSTIPAPGAAHPAPRSDLLGPPHGLGTGQFIDSMEMTNNFGSSIPTSPVTPNLNSYPEATRSTDEFGVGSSGSPVASRFSTYPVTATSTGATGYSLRAEPSIPGEDSFSSSVAAALEGRSSVDEPAPSYETHQRHLPGPPAGAAPPLMMPSPWEIDNRASSYGEDLGLAYMNPSQEEVHPDQNSGQPNREVHFGQVQDIDTEMNRRYEQEEGNSGVRVSPKRVPPPTLNPEEEERALNAAAARELGREMESFNLNSPTTAVPPPPREVGSEMEPFNLNSPTTAVPPPRVEISQDSGGRPRGSSVGSGVGESNSRSVSPLIPPVAPFAQRGTSPTPIEITYNNDHTDQPVSPVRNSPPKMTIPERTASSVSNASNASSYRTPLEYPRSMGASPFGARSTSSLTSPVPAGAPRTISAAAFRRPGAGRSPSNDYGGSGPGLGLGGLRSPASTSSPLADVSPLQPRKRNSSVPRVSSLSQSQSASASNSPELSHLEPNMAGHHRLSQAVNDDHDHYDYISAYTDAPPPPPGSGSPERSDFGSLGQVRVVNEVGTPESPATPNDHEMRHGYGYGHGDGGEWREV